MWKFIVRFAACALLGGLASSVFSVQIMPILHNGGPLPPELTDTSRDIQMILDYLVWPKAPYCILVALVLLIAQKLGARIWVRGILATFILGGLYAVTRFVLMNPPEIWGQVYAWKAIVSRLMPGMFVGGLVTWVLYECLLGRRVQPERRAGG